MPRSVLFRFGRPITAALACLGMGVASAEDAPHSGWEDVRPTGAVIDSLEDAWPDGSVFRERDAIYRSQVRTIRLIEGRVSLVFDKALLESVRALGDDPASIRERVAAALRDGGDSGEVALAIDPGDPVQETVAVSLVHASVGAHATALRSWDSIRDVRLHTPLEAGELVVITDPRGLIAIDAARVSTTSALPESAWRDRVYTTTLVTHGEPVYAIPSQSRFDPAGTSTWQAAFEALATSTGDDTAADAALESLLAHLPSPRDRRWEMLIEAAVAADRTDIALLAHRHYQPVADCSLDMHPRIVADRYAALCARAGRLGCTLALRVRILGDHFLRVAGSSLGEAAARPESESLAETGVDLDRFFLGLLWRFPGDGATEIGVDPWRLARAIRDAGRTQHLAPRLEAYAEDEDLDAYNRLLATQLLVFLGEQAVRDPDLRPAARMGRYNPAPVLDLDLYPAARAWVEARHTDLP